MATFPVSPKPASIAIKSTAPAYVMSSHSLHRKAVTQNVQFFELELEYPPLTRQEFSPIHGFLAKQKGPVGQFDYVPHTHAQPMGQGLAAAETATSNLVKWSERLDLGPWAYADAGNTILGAAVTAPDGRGTGQLWTMAASNVDSWPYIRQPFTLGQLTGLVTASVYMKAPSSGAANRTGIRLYNVTNAVSHILTVAWTAGVPTLSSQASLNSYAIQSVGGGWYRLCIAINLSSYWDPALHQFYLDIYPRINQPSVAAGMHIWGCQTALGSLVTPGYLRTWSSENSRADGPRVPFRKNSLAYSSNFTTSYWAKGCAVLPAVGPVLKKYGTAPDGGLAESWGTPANNGVYGGCLSRAITASAEATQYVFSLYIKKDMATVCGVNLYDATAVAGHSAMVAFDAAGVATLTSVTGDAAGLDVTGDGWYRLWIMVDVADRGLTGHALAAYIYPHDEDDGTPRAAEGTFIWGAQMESGRTRPGPYLPRAAETSPSYSFATGTTVYTEGWLANQSDVLKAGDFVKFAGHTKVYTVVDDVSSDALGLAALTIEPGLLADIVPDEVIQVENVPFLVTLIAPDTSMGWDENVWVRPAVRLLEVI